MKVVVVEFNGKREVVEDVVAIKDSTYYESQLEKNIGTFTCDYYSDGRFSRKHFDMKKIETITIINGKC